MDQKNVRQLKSVSTVQQSELEAAATIKVLEQRFSVIRHAITEKALSVGEMMLENRQYEAAGVPKEVPCAGTGADTQTKTGRQKGVKRMRKRGGHLKKKVHSDDTSINHKNA